MLVSRRRYQRKESVSVDMFPTIKRRKGIPVVIGSITDDTSKEVLLVLRRTTEKPTPTRQLLGGSFPPKRAACTQAV